jgi:PAS domain S-box-containing protein
MAPELQELHAIWLDLRSHVDRLAGERHQYLDFFEQATDAYLVTDVHGTIAEANGAAVDILQRRKHYLRGKPLAVLIALDRRSDFRTRLQALASGNAAAERSWRTVLEAPEVRVDATLTARAIERGGAIAGFCWRVDAAA